MESCGTGSSHTFVKSDSGVFYTVHERGEDTSRPAESDIVTVHMDYRLDDTLLFTSRSLNKDFEFPLIKPMFEGDVYDGIKLMGNGDSMTFRIVADSFYFNTAQLTELPDYVVAGSPMYFDVKLLNHRSQESFEEERKDEEIRLQGEEEEIIKKYLSELDLVIHPQTSGLYYYPLKQGKGKRPDSGDMCRVELTVSLLDGTQLYSNVNSGDPLDVEYGKGFDTQGFMEGLGMLKTGGKALLIVPSKIGVGSSGKNGVPPFTPIQYEMELKRIATIEQVKKERKQRIIEKEKALEQRKLNEPRLIRKYISDNKIDVKPNASGLYFIEAEKGSGDFAQIGDSVWVHYRMYTIEGRQLESSYENQDPFRFALGSGTIIEAWKEALLLMNEGAKATILTPSTLAYGKRRLRNGVEPYSPLIYDLELVKIKKP